MYIRTEKQNRRDSFEQEKSRILNDIFSSKIQKHGGDFIVIVVVDPYLLNLQNLRLIHCKISEKFGAGRKISD